MGELGRVCGRVGRGGRGRGGPKSAAALQGDGRVHLLRCCQKPESLEGRSLQRNNIIRRNLLFAHNRNSLSSRARAAAVGRAAIKRTRQGPAGLPSVQLPATRNWHKPQVTLLALDVCFSSECARQHAPHAHQSAFLRVPTQSWQMLAQDTRPYLSNPSPWWAFVGCVGQRGRDVVVLAASRDPGSICGQEPCLMDPWWCRVRVGVVECVVQLDGEGINV